MELETLEHVIDWTENLHLHLGRCLHQHLDKHHDEHAKMLMTYLAQEEAKLANLVEQFKDQASANALNTWCLEYVTKKSLSEHDECDTAYHAMDADTILAEVVAEHEAAIDLFRYLSGRVDNEEGQTLVNALLDLEQHETMRITHSANRWHDM